MFLLGGKKQSLPRVYLENHRLLLDEAFLQTGIRNRFQLFSISLLEDTLSWLAGRLQFLHFFCFYNCVLSIVLLWSRRCCFLREWWGLISSQANMVFTDFCSQPESTLDFHEANTSRVCWVWYVGGVPNLPKCPAPVRKYVPVPPVRVLVSYRTYRSFRYWC